jgi:hypothetical protein
MAEAQIGVHIRGGQAGRGLRIFAPGETVRGSVTVTPVNSFTCNHLYIRLQWHTEGRGDRDEKNVAEADVFQGELRASVPTTYEFAFTLPNEPWSYAGHYVNIIWGIAVEIDVSWAKDPTFKEPFVLAPGVAES